MWLLGTHTNSKCSYLLSLAEPSILTLSWDVYKHICSQRVVTPQWNLSATQHSLQLLFDFRAVTREACALHLCLPPQTELLRESQSSLYWNQQVFFSFPIYSFHIKDCTLSSVKTEALVILTFLHLAFHSLLLKTNFSTWCISLLYFALPFYICQSVKPFLSIYS